MSSSEFPQVTSTQKFSGIKRPKLDSQIVHYKTKLRSIIKEPRKHQFTLTTTTWGFSGVAVDVNQSFLGKISGKKNRISASEVKRRLRGTGPLMGRGLGEIAKKRD
ncbi:uncharacterized protein G2W53_028035 [Senna tora]|uniref:Uncharacterized protein n=1 Tax=Senna tora TaxID=362788 RepID=A0A834T4G7_9FABA|nr:uncharacterized protein G2W53_028035 [Senna tora]